MTCYIKLLFSIFGIIETSIPEAHLSIPRNRSKLIAITMCWMWDIIKLFPIKFNSRRQPSNWKNRILMWSYILPDNFVVGLICSRKGILELWENKWLYFRDFTFVVLFDFLAFLRRHWIHIITLFQIPHYNLSVNSTTDNNIRIFRVELEGDDFQWGSKNDHWIDGMLVIVIPKHNCEFMWFHIVNDSFLKD